MNNQQDSPPLSLPSAVTVSSTSSTLRASSPSTSSPTPGGTLPHVPTRGSSQVAFGTLTFHGSTARSTLGRTTTGGTTAAAGGFLSSSTTTRMATPDLLMSNGYDDGTTGTEKLSRGELELINAGKLKREITNTVAKDTAGAARPSLFSAIIPQPKDDTPVFWSRLALLLLVIQAALQLVLEIIILTYDGIIYFDLKRYNLQASFPQIEQSLKAGRTYHSAYVASILFGVYITWDATLHQNSVQVIALVGYAIGCLVFSVIQVTQTNNSYSRLLVDLPQIDVSCNRWPANCTSMHVIIGLSAVWVLLFAYLAYKMNQEFGWKIYRVTGGDIRINKALEYYHIQLLFLKFTLFFLALFAVIILVLAQASLLNYFLTIVLGIPWALGTALLGRIGLRKERKILIALFLFGNFWMIGYCLFWLSRVLNFWNSDDLEQTYKYIRTPLTFWGVCAIVMLVATTVMAFLCSRQFGVGLKETLDQDGVGDFFERVRSRKRLRGPQVPTKAAMIDLDS